MCWFVSSSSEPYEVGIPAEEETKGWKMTPFGHKTEGME